MSIPFTLIDNLFRKIGVITKFPFTCGRLPENDLALKHPYVSRRHAEIICEDGVCIVVDLGSRHGTYVNGKLIQQRHPLRNGDVLAFGTLNGPTMEFGVGNATSTSTIRSIIQQLPEVNAAGNSIEKLNWFFEAARKLTGEGGIEQILASLLEIAIELTQVERGYVFLRSPSGEIELTMGRNRDGELLLDDSTISRGAIRQAMENEHEFIVTNTLGSGQCTDSVMANSIRSIVCIPLRSHRRSGITPKAHILGVLYLDSRLRSSEISEIDSNLLRAIATDAAALIDNTQLAITEENERRYREELKVAAQIQSNLMTAMLSDLPFATVAARSIPCREVGGDFFLALADDQSLTVVVADISGKGISAAILASTLQGMIYAQLRSRQPLDHIAATVNCYICEKDIGKYATMTIFRLDSTGRAEYINCGHIPPYICLQNGSLRLTESNLPVGLIPHAEFHSGETRLVPGSRLLIVTDGVTEAGDADGEFFGEDRVAEIASQCASLDDLFLALQKFCRSHPQEDDITVLEVRYTG